MSKKSQVIKRKTQRNEILDKPERKLDYLYIEAKSLTQTLHLALFMQLNATQGSKAWIKPQTTLFNAFPAKISCASLKDISKYFHIQAARAGDAGLDEASRKKGAAVRQGYDRVPDDDFDFKHAAQEAQTHYDNCLRDAEPAAAPAVDAKQAYQHFFASRLAHFQAEFARYGEHHDKTLVPARVGELIRDNVINNSADWDGSYPPDSVLLMHLVILFNIRTPGDSKPSFLLDVLKQVELSAKSKIKIYIRVRIVAKLLQAHILLGAPDSIFKTIATSLRAEYKKEFDADPYFKSYLAYFDAVENHMLGKRTGKRWWNFTSIEPAPDPDVKQGVGRGVGQGGEVKIVRSGVVPQPGAGRGHGSPPAPAAAAAAAAAIPGNPPGGRGVPPASHPAQLSFVLPLLAAQPADLLIFDEQPDQNGDEKAPEGDRNHAAGQPAPPLPAPPPPPASPQPPASPASVEFKVDGEPPKQPEEKGKDEEKLLGEGVNPSFSAQRGSEFTDNPDERQAVIIALFATVHHDAAAFESRDAITKLLYEDEDEAKDKSVLVATLRLDAAAPDLPGAIQQLQQKGFDAETHYAAGVQPVDIKAIDQVKTILTKVNAGNLSVFCDELGRWIDSIALNSELDGLSTTLEELMSKRFKPQLQPVPVDAAELKQDPAKVEAKVVEPVDAKIDSSISPHPTPKQGEGEPDPAISARDIGYEPEPEAKLPNSRELALALLAQLLTPRRHQLRFQLDRILNPAGMLRRWNDPIYGFIKKGKLSADHARKVVFCAQDASRKRLRVSSTIRTLRDEGFSGGILQRLLTDKPESQEALLNAVCLESKPKNLAKTKEFAQRIIDQVTARDRYDLIQALLAEELDQFSAPAPVPSSPAPAAAAVEAKAELKQIKPTQLWDPPTTELQQAILTRLFIQCLPKFATVFTDAKQIAANLMRVKPDSEQVESVLLGFPEFSDIKAIIDTPEVSPAYQAEVQTFLTSHVGSGELLETLLDNAADWLFELQDQNQLDTLAARIFTAVQAIQQQQPAPAGDMIAFEAGEVEPAPPHDEKEEKENKDAKQAHSPAPVPAAAAPKQELSVGIKATMSELKQTPSDKVAGIAEQKELGLSEDEAKGMDEQARLLAALVYAQGDRGAGAANTKLDDGEFLQLVSGALASEPDLKRKSQLLKLFLAYLHSETTFSTTTNLPQLWEIVLEVANQQLQAEQSAQLHQSLSEFVAANSEWLEGIVFPRAAEVVDDDDEAKSAAASLDMAKMTAQFWQVLWQMGQQSLQQTSAGGADEEKAEAKDAPALPTMQQVAAQLPKGYEWRKQPGDHECLYHSLAAGATQNSSPMDFLMVRAAIANHIVTHVDDYKQVQPEQIVGEAVERKVWGGAAQLQVFSDLTRRPIVVICNDNSKTVYPQQLTGGDGGQIRYMVYRPAAGEDASLTPLILGHTYSNHYDAIVYTGAENANDNIRVLFHIAPPQAVLAAGRELSTSAATPAAASAPAPCESVPVLDSSSSSSSSSSASLSSREKKVDVSEVPEAELQKLLAKEKQEESKQKDNSEVKEKEKEQKQEEEQDEDEVKDEKKVIVVLPQPAVLQPLKFSSQHFSAELESSILDNNLQDFWQYLSVSAMVDTADKMEIVLSELVSMFTVQHSSLSATQQVMADMAARALLYLQNDTGAEQAQGDHKVPIPQTSSSLGVSKSPSSLIPRSSSLIPRSSSSAAPTSRSFGLFSPKATKLSVATTAARSALLLRGLLDKGKVDSAKILLSSVPIPTDILTQLIRQFAVMGGTAQERENLQQFIHAFQAYIEWAKLYETEPEAILILQQIFLSHDAAEQMRAQMQEFFNLMVFQFARVYLQQIKSNEERVKKSIGAITDIEERSLAVPFTEQAAALITKFEAKKGTYNNIGEMVQRQYELNILLTHSADDLAWLNNDEAKDYKFVLLLVHNPSSPAEKWYFSTKQAAQVKSGFVAKMDEFTALEQFLRDKKDIAAVQVPAVKQKIIETVITILNYKFQTWYKLDIVHSKKSLDEMLENEKKGLGAKQYKLVCFDPSPCWFLVGKESDGARVKKPVTTLASNNSKKRDRVVSVSKALTELRLSESKTIPQQLADIQAKQEQILNDLAVILDYDNPKELTLTVSAVDANAFAQIDPKDAKQKELQLVCLLPPGKVEWYIVGKKEGGRSVSAQLLTEVAELKELSTSLPSFEEEKLLPALTPEAKEITSEQIKAIQNRERRIADEVNALASRQEELLQALSGYFNLNIAANCSLSLLACNSPQDIPTAEQSLTKIKFMLVYMTEFSSWCLRHGDGTITPVLAQLESCNGLASTIITEASAAYATKKAACLQELSKHYGDVSASNLELLLQVFFGEPVHEYQSDAANKPELRFITRLIVGHLEHLLEDVPFELLRQQLLSRTKLFLQLLAMIAQPNSASDRLAKDKERDNFLSIIEHFIKSVGVDQAQAKKIINDFVKKSFYVPISPKDLEDDKLTLTNSVSGHYRIIAGRIANVLFSNLFRAVLALTEVGRYKEKAILIIYDLIKCIANMNVDGCIIGYALISESQFLLDSAGKVGEPGPLTQLLGQLPTKHNIRHLDVHIARLKLWELSSDAKFRNEQEGIEEQALLLQRSSALIPTGVILPNSLTLLIGKAVARGLLDYLVDFLFQSEKALTPADVALVLAQMQERMHHHDPELATNLEELFATSEEKSDGHKKQLLLLIMLRSILSKQPQVAGYVSYAVAPRYISNYHHSVEIIDDGDLTQVVGRLIHRLEFPLTLELPGTEVAGFMARACQSFEVAEQKKKKKEKTKKEEKEEQDIRVVHDDGREVESKSELSMHPIIAEQLKQIMQDLRSIDNNVVQLLEQLSVTTAVDTQPLLHALPQVTKIALTKLAQSLLPTSNIYMLKERSKDLSSFKPGDYVLVGNAKNNKSDWELYYIDSRSAPQKLTVDPGAVNNWLDRVRADARTSGYELSLQNGPGSLELLKQVKSEFLPELSYLITKDADEKAPYSLRVRHAKQAYLAIMLTKLYGAIPQAKRASLNLQQQQFLDKLAKKMCKAADVDMTLVQHLMTNLQPEPDLNFNDVDAQKLWSQAREARDFFGQCIAAASAAKSRSATPSRKSPDADAEAKHRLPVARAEIASLLTGSLSEAHTTVRAIVANELAELEKASKNPEQILAILNGLGYLLSAYAQKISSKATEFSPFVSIMIIQQHQLTLSAEQRIDFDDLFYRLQKSLNDVLTKHYHVAFNAVFKAQKSSEKRARSVQKAQEAFASAQTFLELTTPKFQHRAEIRPIIAFLQFWFYGANSMSKVAVSLEIKERKNKGVAFPLPTVQFSSQELSYLVAAPALVSQFFIRMLGTISDQELEIITNPEEWLEAKLLSSDKLLNPNKPIGQAAISEFLPRVLAYWVSSLCYTWKQSHEQQEKLMVATLILQILKVLVNADKVALPIKGCVIFQILVVFKPQNGSRLCAASLLAQLAEVIDPTGSLYQELMPLAHELENYCQLYFDWPAEISHCHDQHIARQKGDEHMRVRRGNLDIVMAVSSTPELDNWLVMLAKAKLPAFMQALGNSRLLRPRIYFDFAAWAAIAENGRSPQYAIVLTMAAAFFADHCVRRSAKKHLLSDVERKIDTSLMTGELFTPMYRARIDALSTTLTNTSELVPGLIDTGSYHPHSVLAILKQLELVTSAHRLGLCLHQIVLICQNQDPATVQVKEVKAPAVAAESSEVTAYASKVAESYSPEQWLQHIFMHIAASDDAQSVSSALSQPLQQLIARVPHFSRVMQKEFEQLAGSDYYASVHLAVLRESLAIIGGFYRKPGSKDASARIVIDEVAYKLLLWVLNTFLMPKGIVVHLTLPQQLYLADVLRCVFDEGLGWAHYKSQTGPKGTLFMDYERLYAFFIPGILLPDQIKVLTPLLEFIFEIDHAVALDSRGSSGQSWQKALAYLGLWKKNLPESAAVVTSGLRKAIRVPTHSEAVVFLYIYFVDKLNAEFVKIEEEKQPLSPRSPSTPMTPASPVPMSSSFLAPIAEVQAGVVKYDARGLVRKRFLDLSDANLISALMMIRGSMTILPASLALDEKEVVVAPALGQRRLSGIGQNYALYTSFRPLSLSQKVADYRKQMFNFVVNRWLHAIEIDLLHPETAATQELVLVETEMKSVSAAELKLFAALGIRRIEVENKDGYQLGVVFVAHLTNGVAPAAEDKVNYIASSIFPTAVERQVEMGLQHLHQDILERTVKNWCWQKPGASQATLVETMQASLACFMDHRINYWSSRLLQQIFLIAAQTNSALNPVPADFKQQMILSLLEKGYYALEVQKGQFAVLSFNANGVIQVAQAAQAPTIGRDGAPAARRLLRLCGFSYQRESVQIGVEIEKPFQRDARLEFVLAQALTAQFSDVVSQQQAQQLLLNQLSVPKQSALLRAVVENNMVDAEEEKELEESKGIDPTQVLTQGLEQQLTGLVRQISKDKLLMPQYLLVNVDGILPATFMTNLMWCAINRQPYLIPEYSQEVMAKTVNLHYAQLRIDLCPSLDSPALENNRGLVIVNSEALVSYPELNLPTEAKAIEQEFNEAAEKTIAAQPLATGAERLCQFLITCCGFDGAEITEAWVTQHKAKLLKLLTPLIKRSFDAKLAADMINWFTVDVIHRPLAIEVIDMDAANLAKFTELREAAEKQTIKGLLLSLKANPNNTEVQSNLLIEFNNHFNETEQAQQEVKDQRIRDARRMGIETRIWLFDPSKTILGKMAVFCDKVVGVQAEVKEDKLRIPHFIAEFITLLPPGQGEGLSSLLAEHLPATHKQEVLMAFKAILLKVFSSNEDVKKKIEAVFSDANIRACIPDLIPPVAVFGGSK